MEWTRLAPRALGCRWQNALKEEVSNFCFVCHFFPSAALAILNEQLSRAMNIRSVFTRPGLALKHALLLTIILFNSLGWSNGWARSPFADAPKPASQPESARPNSTQPPSKTRSPFANGPSPASQPHRPASVQKAPSGRSLFPDRPEWPSRGSAPIASAGPDQLVPTGATVTLDGTRSSGGIGSSGNLTYTWSFSSKPPGSRAALREAGDAAPTFLADKVGKFVLELVVTDKHETVSQSDEVVVTSSAQPSNPGRPQAPQTQEDEVVVTSSGKPSKPNRPQAPQTQGYKKWFVDNERRPLEIGNEISILNTIEDIKTEMAKAILTVTGPSHYVYMCNWKAEADLQFKGTGATTTLIGLLTTASEKGARVRALLYAPMSKIIGRKENVSFGNIGNNYSTNSDLAQKIEKLANGEACLDDKRLMWGAHHQKLLIVRGNKGLIAFCGSYDPDRTREGDNEYYSDPWHEVTLRVQGPAAYRLLQVFMERWIDAKVPPENRHDAEFRAAIGRSARQERLDLSGGIPAQVTITAGNLKDNKTSRWDPVTQTDASKLYDFAPSGEMSYRKALAHAIKTAKSDIYLECQYGWGESGAMGETLRTLLAQALANRVSVTVVTPIQDTVHELGFGDVMVAGGAIATGAWKKGILGGLLGAVLAGGVETGVRQLDFKRAQDWFWHECAKDNNDLRIFHTNGSRDINITKTLVKGPRPAKNHFIHSKLWIFDNEFAIIGSANFNNRSLSYDSEVMVGFYDPVHLAPLRRLLEHKHVPINGITTEYNEDTMLYAVPKVLYEDDSLKGFGNALSDWKFTETIDPYGGPRNESQIVTSLAPWVSELNAAIETAMHTDLIGYK